jgi:hypothetical protein
MQVEETCIAETMKLMEYVKSKDPLIQIVMTHQHNTNYTTSVTKFKKSFQSETKEINT